MKRVLFLALLLIFTASASAQTTNQAAYTIFHNSDIYNGEAIKLPHFQYAIVLKDGFPTLFVSDNRTLKAILYTDKNYHNGSKIEVGTGAGDVVELYGIPKEVTNNDFGFDYQYEYKVSKENTFLVTFSIREDKVFYILIEILHS